jgi:oxaloacetate decarboxylase beta subunit
MDFIEMLRQLALTSGFAALTWQHIVMLLVSFTLMYLAIVKKFEPLLLLPISFGMMLANLPMTGLMHNATAAAYEALAYAEASGDSYLITSALLDLANVRWYDSGILYNLYLGIRSVLFPALIFLGVGAMTDFGPMLANPKCMLIGAAAQIGIFSAFAMANLSGLFTPEQSAVIGIIGSADGPTTIFLASRLAPEIMGPVAVAAYSYMALVPLIQPPIMKALTTEKERVVKMEHLRTVSKRERIIFPIAIAAFCLLITPTVAPLIGMFMLGNLFRESGVVDRLNDTAQNALINIVTMLLGITVGATTNGETFLQVQTIAIVALGLTAFALSTVGGVLFGKLMYRLTGGKVNPLIGAAGVSAMPMSPRVVQMVGKQYNPNNFLLMHAMGPSIAAIIGSAIVAGFFIVIFGG